MKKVILVLMGLFLFYQNAEAAKYYCPENSGSNYYSINDIYDTEGDCSSWNSDFFRKNSPDTYTKCLKKNEMLRSAFASYLWDQCEGKTGEKTQNRNSIKILKMVHIKKNL